MNTAVFDIEADGLLEEATKIHCLVYKDLSTNKIHALTENFTEFFDKYDRIIGHNIVRYDLPLVEKITGYKYTGTVVDTLALSWYLNPKWRVHGLEAIGEMYGVPKPPIEDWENLELVDYVHRCEEDVKINSLLWNDLKSSLDHLYEYEEKDVNRIIAYLTFKMQCARKQEELGWKLDVPMATENLDKLLGIIEDAQNDIQEAMPKVPVIKTAKRPAKFYKRNGDLSKAALNWLELCENHQENREQQSFEYVAEYKEANPGSVKQVKEWLYSLGWVPDEFNYVREADGSLRKIPQIYIKNSGGELSASVMKLAEDHPELKSFIGLSVAKHRSGILKGMLESVDGKGYIKATIGGLTNTLRFKHRAPLVNLPGVDKEWGDVIRGVLTCEEGEVLCGSDCSSLEDRTKQHFIYPYDPEYVEAMTKPDFDPHIELAYSAGAVTLEEMQGYKADTLPEDEKKRLAGVRHVYKQANYAAVYGAQAPRLALTAGISEEEAQQVLDAYWKKNWAVEECVKDLPVKRCNGQDWLYNPVSHFWYSLRSEKDKFSTLNQGTGVYCFDTWVRKVKAANGGAYDTIIGQFHDEIIGRYPEEMKDEVEKLYKECIQDVNRQLKLNRELDVDVQFGERYSEIH